MFLRLWSERQLLEGTPKVSATVNISYVLGASVLEALVIDKS
jgi:hypothetical protein